MEQIRDRAENSAGGGARPARCFAIVLITEALSGEEAGRLLKNQLGAGDAYRLAGACPVGPAVKYEVVELRLSEDGEPVVTTPAS
jgi:hypothetical protein